MKRVEYGIFHVALAISAMAVVLQAAFVGCAKSPEMERLERVRSGEERLNVILISIDTLRADALGCYGGDIAETPNIDRLAAGGTLFAECKSPMPLTLPSHTSMLTGTYPPYHGIRDNDLAVPAELVFLSELLHDNGYRTAAIIGGVPLDDVFGFDQGFDYYDDDFTRGRGTSLVKFETPADILALRCRKWLAENEKEPFFLFVHFFDPHRPYTPTKKYYDRYGEQPYYGEVALVDEAIGEIIDTLERNGLSDNTLVILTADHGESLGDHGEITHGFFVYESTQHVPLIFYCPGLIPGRRVVNGAVCITDIPPTVLDLLGVDAPAPVQGESLEPLLYRERKADRAIYEEAFYGAELFGWAPLYALEEGGWKFIAAPEPELYNLNEDPSEETNLADEEAGRASRMAEELDGLVARLSENAANAEDLAPLTDSDKEKLETLGYFSIGGGRKKPGAVDPKNKIETMRLYIEYQEALSPPDNERLIKILKKMAELEPNSAFPLVTMGIIYRNLGDYENAEAYLKKTLELDRRHIESKNQLAKIYILTGEYAAAKALLDEVQKDPYSTPVDLAKAYVSRGNVSVLMNEPVEEAAEYYKLAIELHKDFPKPYYELALLYEGAPGGGETAKEYAALFLDITPRGEGAARMRAILGQEPVEILASKGKRAYLDRDFEKAAGYFRRAYEQDPGYYEMRYNLACCLALDKRPDEAIKELEALVRDAPGVYDEALARDPDLDSLRGRGDFKELLE
jgi:arylsulfatase A-like enzyme/thioredoxin-like negative regulator of GroEL